MPVPSSISDLSTTPSLNSPAGTESPSTVDDYLRTQAAFIKQVDDKATGAVKATDLAAPGGSALVGYQQAGAGAVARTAQSKLRDVVSVLDFGASPSETAAVNTASIQAAADYCETTGAFLQGAPGAYSTNGTIVLNCSGDLSAMTLNVDATVVSTAVRVGPNAAGQYLFDVNLQLPFVNNTAKTGAGWAGFDTSIGVHIANVYQSRITVPSVYNFGIGLKEGGFGVGCVYNTITIGVLYGNKVSQLLQAGDTNGWSNQNTHIGGRFAHASSEGSAVAGTAHIKLRDFAIGGSNAPNTNLWLNPSIEGNEPEFHVDIQGSYNSIISPRLELSGGVPARINFHAETANETVGNQFFGGYKAGITYTYSGAGTSNANGYIGGRGGNTFDVSGSGYNVRNVSGNTIGAPHFQGFPSTVDALNKNEAATDWTYRIFGEGFAVKATGSTHPRVQVDSSGYVFFGSGSAAVAGGLRYNATPAAITSNIDFAPDTNATLKLGTANRQWAQIWATLPTHPDNTAALAGGLTAGAFYKTATGELRVVV